MAQKPKICVARSEYDLATTYLNAWMLKIIDYARKMGYQVIDLPKVRKEKFEEAIEFHKPHLFIGGGHGGAVSFSGQEREIILIKCVNDQLLQNKLCYLIACDTGAELGPSMVDKGALAFIGWQDDFIFGVHRNYLEKPTEDPYAYSYFDSALNIAYALLDGKTVREAYETGIDTFNKWISFWQGVKDPYASELITWLYWDRDNLIAITKTGLYETPTPTVEEIPAPKMNLLPLLIAPAGISLLYILRRF